MKGLVMGRVVRYVHWTRSQGGKIVAMEESAAIVVKVYEGDRCDLQVFNDARIEFVANANYSEQPECGRWHWPPKDE